ncbi:MAG: PQQ-like beta-propeller repeat protein [Pyrinomonadaceae bacterium]|nr:PQQ-like beta-propeller repeat protein [Pyrinomonadaceae bacterium]
MCSQLFDVQNTKILENYFSKLIFKTKFFFIVLLILGSTAVENIKAQNSTSKPLQNNGKLTNGNEKDENKSLNLCWQITSDANSTGLTPTVSATQTLIPLSNGDLKALNAFDGSQLWISTLGGEIAASPLITGKTVFVINEVQTEAAKEDAAATPIPENLKPIKASNQSNESVIKTFLVRGLSSTTGLTLWQRQFSASSISMAKDDSKIFVAVGGLNESSTIIALNEKTGADEWSKNLSSNVFFPVIVESGLVYLVTKNGFINGFDVKDGTEKTKYKFDKFAPTRFTPSSKVLIFGDSSGNVAAVDASNQQLLWKLRIGGATQSFLPTPNGFLIASLDNFVYFQTLLKGKRLWRRRLAGRPIGGLIFSEKFALICVSGDDSAMIINLQDGKIAGEAFLGVDNYAISPPTTNGKFIVVQTAKGLMSFAISQTDCGKPI